MKFPLLRGALCVAIAAAATVATAPAAHAQIGVYLNPAVSRISNKQLDTGNFSFLGTTSKARWFGGPAFGVYYDGYKMGSFNAGVDLRDTIQHANNAAINTFMVAPRIVYVRNERLRPYAEVGVGATSTKPEKSDLRKTNFRLDVLVGADYRLAKHVDFRVAEIGYSTLGAVSTGAFGNNGGKLPYFTAFDISSGLVFRFGK